MGASVALASFAGLLAVAAPRFLTSVARQVSPRQGIVVWASVCGAFVLAVVGAGISMTAPTHLLVHGLHDLFHACAAAVAGLDDHGGGRAVGTTGAALAGLAAGAAATGVTRTVWHNRRERDRQRRMTDLVGRVMPGPELVCLDVDQPAVYCLAGRPGRIVLTRGALSALEGDELAAAVAHEREHLRARHYVLLAVADGLARVFPFVPLVTEARRQLRYLVELAADDVAARRHGPWPLSRAIMAVAAGSVPRNGLGANAGHLLSRVERLRSPGRPPSPRARFTAAAVCTTALLVPVVVTGGTLWSAALDDHCSHPVTAGDLRAELADSHGDHDLQVIARPARY
ncbi:MAG TPA: M56 family metallopeptidase [Jiangellales bacterium]|nr:M56 family metallopeptidase [Jiangellales bacterium]